ncbi:MAG: hypothetical protein LBF02_01130 [Mycoplasmataceae bacterium]|nr:hypothetical protein [Mycoplasmataceae bacterium]
MFFSIISSSILQDEKRSLTVLEYIGIYVLIPLIFLIAIALLSIWIKNKQNIKSLRKIYREYDDIKLFFYWLNVGYIENFSNNEKIRNFTQTIKNKKKEIEEKLLIINGLIKIHSIDVKKFYFNKKLYETIKKNLRIIESSRQSIENDIKEVKKAIIKINDFSFSLIKIYNDSLSFYHKYLLNKNYKNDEFKVLILKIKSILLETQNRFSNSQNLISIKKTISKIIEELTQFISKIEYLYIYDELLRYLNILIEMKIIPYLNSKNNLKTSTTINLKQQLIIGKDALNKLEYYLHQLDFNQIQAYALIAQRSIENFWNKISNEEKIVEIININFEFIENTFSEFEKNMDFIFASLVDIGKNFDADEEVNEKLKSFKNKLVVIISKFQLLRDTYKKKISNNNEEIKKNISSLLFNTKNWLNEWTDFVNILFEKNKKFRFINDLFSEIQNTISHLKCLNSSLTSSDNSKEIEELNIFSKRVEEIFNGFENDYEKTKIEILQIKNDLFSLIQKINLDFYLFKYLQALFFFLNKYRYENKQINDSLEQIENNIKETNVEDSLVKLIEMAEKIKLSSKFSGEEMR